VAALGGVVAVRFVAFIVGAGGRASLCPFLDHFLTPKPHFGRSLGVILAPLRLHFGALDPPGGPNGDPQGSKVHFSWILGALGVPLGGHFGTILLTFSSLLVSKLQVALRTCFLSGFGMDK
jgi:hypothetical protein